MKMFSDAAIAPQAGVRANRASPVIVATDGHDQSNSAMLLGRLLAPEKDALRIVTVLKQLPSVTPEMPISMSADAEASRRAEQKTAGEAPSGTGVGRGACRRRAM
jgi:hypothetical protein